MLKSNRLLIRDFTHQDLKSLSQIASEGQSVKISKFKLHKQTRYWIEHNIKSYQQCSAGVWALELINTGQLIGQAGLYFRLFNDKTSLSNNPPELSFALLNTHQRQKFGFEACKKIIDYSHLNLKLIKLSSYVHHLNNPAINLLKILGFNESKSKYLKSCDQNMIEYLIKF